MKRENAKEGTQRDGEGETNYYLDDLIIFSSQIFETATQSKEISRNITEKRRKYLRSTI